MANISGDIKRFGRETYHKYSWHYSKKAADKVASGLRSAGNKVRVLKAQRLSTNRYGDVGEWTVWNVWLSTGR